MDGKEKILDVALRVFAERGLQKAKISDIAESAGMSKKTIYKHFQGKEDLILQVYSSLIWGINNQVEELANSDKSLPNKLAGIVKIAADKLDIITPALISDAKGRLPAVKGFLGQYIENAVFNRFRALIEDGIKSNDIKSNVGVDSVILLYRDAIFSFIYMRFNKNVPEGVNVKQPLSVFCEALVTIFRGILVEESERELDQYLSQIKY
ncbi:MAG: TetR/AcrR family transcriptional regulator [Cyclobacteriaceae bacterium]